MSSPEMTPVDSSILSQIGYEASAEELYVEFKGGRTYVYAGVPESTAREIMNADSKGGYLNREVKPIYGCRRLI